MTRVSWKRVKEMMRSTRASSRVLRGTDRARTSSGRRENLEQNSRRVWAIERMRGHATGIGKTATARVI